MNNKERVLQILSTSKDEYIAKTIARNMGKIATEQSSPCHDCVQACGTGECTEQITDWLRDNYVPPKKELTQAQLCEAFEMRFRERRAISLDEVKDTIGEMFK